MGDKWAPSGFPVEFLSLGGDRIGVPVRAAIASCGSILLLKVLVAQ
ncbi:helicase HerA-like domain-containing protein [Mycobacterium lepromatosis]